MLNKFFIFSGVIVNALSYIIIERIFLLCLRLLGIYFPYTDDYMFSVVTIVILILEFLIAYTILFLLSRGKYQKFKFKKLILINIVLSATYILLHTVDMWAAQVYLEIAALHVILLSINYLCLERHCLK